MGSSVVGGVEVRFSATGVAAVQSGLRLVKSEAASVNAATAGVSTATAGVAKGFKSASNEAEAFSASSIYGLGEIARGLGRVSQGGLTNAMGMRELSGGIMRLGMGFGGLVGTIAPVVGIVAILGAAITEMFMKSRSELAATQRAFTEGIAKMANAGQGVDLVKKARDLSYGTPYDDKDKLRGPSSVPGAFEGSLLDLRSRMGHMQSQLLPSGYLANDVANQPILKAMRQLQPQLDAMEAQARQIQTAIETIASQPATMGMIPMKTTAPRIKSADRMSSDAATAREKEITLLVEEAKAHGINNTALARAVVLYQQLQSEMAHPKDALQAAQLAKQAEALWKLPGLGPQNQLVGDVGKPLSFSLEDLFQTTPQLGIVGKLPKVGNIKDNSTKSAAMTAFDDLQAESAKRITTLGDSIQSQLTNTLGSSIAKGIQAGFATHSVSGAFRGLGSGILSGLGGAFVAVGESALTGLVFMAKIKTAIEGFSPEVGIASALGLIAFGSLLESAGSGGGSGGGGSSSAAYSGPTTSQAPFIVGAPSHVVSAAGVTPVAPVTVNATIIGKNDPTAQRDIMELFARAQRRGSTSG